MHRTSVLFAAVLSALLAVPVLAAGSDPIVTSGSPAAPFSQNKQNEPAVAIDAHATNILAAGANDNIDDEACNAGDDTTCPFTAGVGGSGVYFSTNGGTSWTQPIYSGWTARNCQGVPGPDAGCVPEVGPIGTLPWYYESGLVSDGDPAVAFGPRPGANGFSWSNGSRLYYANLTSNFGATRTDATFKGFEAIAVSRTDNVAAAAANDKSAWMPPVLVSKQSTTTFTDKEQIWADNASSSAFFGNVYACWADFKGQEKGNAAPAPLIVGVSSDGGATWTQHPISASANNSQRNPSDGCTIRTDSKGNAYVFGIGTSSSGGHQAFEIMSVSHNGGHTWSSGTPVVGPVTQPGVFDPVVGRPTIDGIVGARSDLAPAPSVDIANGAPTGTDATDRMVMSYVSGTLAAPHTYFTESTNRGATWSTPRAIETAGDRGIYTAPAISPNGTDVYVVYNAFTTPYRSTTSTPRRLVGVVLHADSSTAPGSPTGGFTQMHRSARGDPRASSQNNLAGEFLGDYVYAAATRTYGTAVWNDTSSAADCPAMDAWRQSLVDGTNVPRPAPEQDCPATFGNSNILGGTFTDPTP
ncbi:MAG: hypothetical protein QOJ33_2192 [Chloroflexota bacterium]|nr:hypothetical protein [Chloroflexota bacterium]